MVDFVSFPVMKAFTAAAAITIAMSQIKVRYLERSQVRIVQNVWISLTTRSRISCECRSPSPTYYMPRPRGDEIRWEHVEKYKYEKWKWFFAKNNSFLNKAMYILLKWSISELHWKMELLLFIIYYAFCIACPSGYVVPCHPFPPMLTNNTNDITTFIDDWCAANIQRNSLEWRYNNMYGYMYILCILSL